MKKLFLLTLFVSSMAMADSTIVVRCWAPKYEKQNVHLKIQNGKITNWDQNHVARPDAKSIFGMLSEPIKDGAIESVRIGRGKNGFVFVTVVTTADSVTVGVSPDLKRGFYNYKDLGSGNGNDNIELVCQQVL